MKPLLCRWLYTAVLIASSYTASFAFLTKSPPQTNALSVKPLGHPIERNTINSWLVINQHLPRIDQTTAQRSMSKAMESDSVNPDPGTEDAAKENLPRKKILLCVRHGRSVANEWMSEPGNEWFSPNFTDDDKADAPLSETGRRDTQQYLEQQWKEDSGLADLLNQVEVALISPLTRCIETFDVGIAPQLSSNPTSSSMSRIAVPLLRERVYSTSDTGRPMSALAKDFPHLDFSEFPSSEDAWWYDGTKDENYVEWRASEQNQYYGVRGEPQEVFDQRMKELDDYISRRPEKILLIVAHWGVLHHLTDGTEWKNAEAKILEYSFCPVRRRSTIKHIEKSE